MLDEYERVGVRPFELRPHDLFLEGVRLVEGTKPKVYNLAGSLLHD
jgi:hypothetical protein